MKTTEQRIADAVPTTRSAAVAALQAAKAALKAYEDSIDLALATTREYSQDLQECSREARQGADHVYDALSAVERFS